MSTNTLSDIDGREFDYVIIGGGTAGLCLAARLSEDEGVTVAVLEAGQVHLNDPVTTIPGLIGRHFGDPMYDWAFKTVPQKHASGATFSWNRGKCLGGTSSINNHLWHRPHQSDIDAWEKLGNPGWNWDRFLESCKKSERFKAPPEDLAEKYRQRHNPASHGTTGSVSVMFPIRISEYDIPFQETLNSLGVKTLEDAANGQVCGTFQTTLSLHDNITRCSSATAYYNPNASRANLFVLAEAAATRIITVRAEAGAIKGTGVEFQHSGKACMLHAVKEVILSAGAIQSPQLLELSGIGDPAVLKPLGIPVVANLPGVGRNVQDHISFAVSLELSDEQQWETFDLLRDPKIAPEQLKLHSKRKGLFTMSAASLTFLPMQEVAPGRVDEFVKSAERLVINAPPALQEQYAIQMYHLQDKNVPDCEIGLHPGFWSVPNPPRPGKRYLTLVAILSHPFSRGTVHAGSIGHQSAPLIDPHYLEEELDLEMLLETVKFIRKLPATEPFKGMIVKEINPGSEITTDDQLRATIRQHLRSVWHTCGSLSMLPKDKGGVVDTHLRVWGTDNIRVVDLSVAPLMPLAHTQSTAYAIAERAAEIIVGEKTAKGRL